MFCPQCGSVNADGARFCTYCGVDLTQVTPAPSIKRPVPAARPANSTPPVTRQRPGVITLLAVLQFISAGISALAAIFVAVVAFTADDSAQRLVALFVVVFFVAAAALNVVGGRGLWTLRSYGRTIQLVFSWIGLIGFPVGTLLSILILIYLYKPGVKVLFSETPIQALSEEEWQQLATLNTGSSVAMVIVAVLVAFAGIAFVGIIAAIAVPGLLRARMSGNEASAIGALRAINIGEATFASSCGGNGYAATLDALATPPAGGTVGFIPGELASGTRSGYVLTLSADEVSAGVSARACNGAPSVASYFAEIHPAVIGSTGQRSFATDTRGTIYYRNDGVAITPGMAGAMVLQ